MEIDILIPTYQRAESLLANLEHILRRVREEDVDQHYRILISDNASSDGTEARVRSLADRVNGSRRLITYHRNEENIGLEANVVQVARLASSEFVLWCGDDDFFAEGYLRFLVDTVASRPRLGCVIPGLATLHRDGKVDIGRTETFGVREFAPGYGSVYALSHLAHQMSGLLFRREGLLEDYLAQPEYRNPYLFIYFAANRLQRYEGVYAPKFATRVTAFNEKAWGYNSIGLLDEIFKSYLALRPGRSEREVDELMLRFVLMHSYRLALRPLRPTTLAKQFLKVWKAGSNTLYFRRKMGLLFLREAASSVLR